MWRTSRMGHEERHLLCRCFQIYFYFDFLYLFILSPPQTPTRLQRQVGEKGWGKAVLLGYFLLSGVLGSLGQLIPTSASGCLQPLITLGQQLPGAAGEQQGEQQGSSFCFTPVLTTLDGGLYPLSQPLSSPDCFWSVFYPSNSKKTKTEADTRSQGTKVTHLAKLFWGHFWKCIEFWVEKTID